MARSIVTVHSITLKLIQDKLITFLVLGKTFSACLTTVVMCEVYETVGCKVFSHHCMLLLLSLVHAVVISAFEEDLIYGLVSSCYIWFEEDAVLVRQLYHSLTSVNLLLQRRRQIGRAGA